MSLRSSTDSTLPEDFAPSAENKQHGECKVEEGLKSEQEDIPQPSQYLTGWRLYGTVTG